MKSEGYYTRGHALGLLANRTSYVFDFRGPSYACDTACSSSLTAFVNAVNDLRNDIIDYAIVSGVQLNTLPYDAIEFNKLGILSPDGISKSFSSERSGFCRSEAIISVLIQKKKNCRRAYATIIGGGINVDGYKKEGISYPAPEIHLNLIQQVFRDFEINPNDVTYFEAHSTGKVVFFF